MSAAKHTPTPLLPIDLDDDGLTLSHQGAILARVYDAGDFPCCDEDQAEPLEKEQRAFAIRLRDSYNSHDALVAKISEQQIDINTLNAAIEGLRETNREQRQERDGLVAALDELINEIGAFTTLDADASLQTKLANARAALKAAKGEV